MKYLFIIFLICGASIISAQEYNLEYYFSKNLTGAEMRDLQNKIGEEITQSKSQNTREAVLKTLSAAQVYGILRGGDFEDPTAIAEFAAIRDYALTYLKSNNDDDVKLELALLIQLAFPLYLNDLYQSIRLIQDLPTQVYGQKPNALASLLVGASYAGGTKIGASFSAGLAEKYLQEALDLDDGKSYVSYLAHIYRANLNFILRKFPQVHEDIKLANQQYPDGSYANFVDSFFFKNGKSFFGS